MLKYLLPALLILFVPLAWADETPALFSGGGGADEQSSADEGGDGKMKASGGFVNMEPQTDYDAPEPERAPASGDEDQPSDETKDE